MLILRIAKLPSSQGRLGHNSGISEEFLLAPCAPVLGVRGNQSLEPRSMDSVKMSRPTVGALDLLWFQM